MANSSLKENIYTYLNGISDISSTVDQIAWGQMPDTAVDKKQIVYAMLNDNRIADSYFRNQLYRFWICIPDTESTPKNTVLTIANLLLDNLHEVRGTFGAVKIHFSENVSNQDPFYDVASNYWIIIQDYKLKMKTLEV